MAIAIDLPVVTPAVTATFEAAVILPCASMVSDGIKEALPYVAAVTPVLANLAALNVPVVKLEAFEVEATVANSEPPGVDPS